MGVLATIADEVRAWTEAAAGGMPGRLGRAARRRRYRRRFAAFGEGVVIQPGCRFSGHDRISVGSDVTLCEGCQVVAEGDGSESVRISDHAALNSNVMVNAGEGGSIEIGAWALVGPNTVFRASNHEFSETDTPVRKQGHRPGRIVVGEDAWIGANVVVLPGVTIGRGAIVGAGAVVTGDVEPFAIVAGVPARRIGTRGE